MTILAINTSTEEAEILIYDESKLLEQKRWKAHRRLAETIHTEIEKLLAKLSISSNDIDGIVCFSGPGSFTGLRIGISVANAMAYSLDIPIVASSGKSWKKNGIEMISDGKDNKLAIPKYGSAAATSKPVK